MGVQGRRLVAVLLAAGGLLLGPAAELAAKSKPSRKGKIHPNPKIDATSSHTQSRVPFSIELWRINAVAGGWFTEATAYADFNGDGQVDVAAMPIDFDFEPYPLAILTGIDDPTTATARATSSSTTARAASAG
jgi:hypothetical protein